MNTKPNHNAGTDAGSTELTMPATSPTETRSPTAAPAAPIPKRAVWSWVIYDLANTIFSMGVISMYFPLWLRGTLGKDQADAYNGIITSISMGIIFVVSPLLGAMTDKVPRRMPFLWISTALCVLMTGLMGRVGFWGTILMFALANVAYQAGLQFYDALLPEVSTEENRGKVGGMGVGLGYLGSYLAIGVAAVLGWVVGYEDKPLYFSIVALLFFLLSLPCFLFVRERGNPNPIPITWKVIADSTRETWTALRSTQQFPGLLRFLIGRVFYTDSINTVIGFMTLFATNVILSTHPGMSDASAESGAKLVMLPAITFAILGGFGGGWVTDRLGPRRTLNLVLYLWMFTFLLASLVGLLGLPLWVLYIVAVLAGIAIGGTWAADRPYMLRLTPPTRIGEFYGLYGMVGRFSAITGPALWSTVFYLAREKANLSPIQSQGLCILTLLLMIGLSYVILQPISDEPRRWQK
jgi:MFS transporter, UMF1 family